MVSVCQPVFGILRERRRLCANSSSHSCRRRSKRRLRSETHYGWYAYVPLFVHLRSDFSLVQSEVYFGLQPFSSRGSGRHCFSFLLQILCQLPTTSNETTLPPPPGILCAAPQSVSLSTNSSSTSAGRRPSGLTCDCTQEAVSEGGRASLPTGRQKAKDATRAVM